MIQRLTRNLILLNAELEKLDENLHEKPNENVGPPKRYYFENLKISLPQVKLSVFTSHKLPPDLKVTSHVYYSILFSFSYFMCSFISCQIINFDIKQHETFYWLHQVVTSGGSMQLKEKCIAL